MSHSIKTTRELIVILHNIRSTYNVGAILRTCDGFGVKQVIFSGYTPRVHDPNLLPHLREKLDHQISKTALGAEDLVPIKNIPDLHTELTNLRAEHFKIIGLENNINKPLHNLADPILKSSKIALLLGEEVSGIPTEFFDQIDLFAEIPMRGHKESFNVSVAAGIALYELSR